MRTATEHDREFFCRYTEFLHTEERRTASGYSEGECREDEPHLTIRLRSDRFSFVEKLPDKS